MLTILQNKGEKNRLLKWHTQFSFFKKTPNRETVSKLVRKMTHFEHVRCHGGDYFYNFVAAKLSASSWCNWTDTIWRLIYLSITLIFLPIWLIMRRDIWCDVALYASLPKFLVLDLFLSFSFFFFFKRPKKYINGKLV